MFSKKRILNSTLYSALFGIIAGFLFSAGKVLDKTDSIQFSDPGLYLRMVIIAVISSFICFGLWTAWDFIVSKSVKETKAKRIPFPVMMGVQFLLWIPYWLSVYPGVFSYDAYDEWRMVADGIYSSHHPLIHTLFLGGAVEGIHAITGNYNLGIAVYTIVQMLLLSACFSYIIYRLNKRFHSFFMQVATLVYFSLQPVIAMFAIAAVKDTLFCAAEMAFFLLIFEFFRNREEFLKDRNNVKELAAFAFLTMILRNNGLYIALVCVVLILIFSIPYLKKYYKKLLLLIALIAVPYFLYIGPLSLAFRCKVYEPQEKLSVPLQQMARVYKYNKDTLPKEETDLLMQYVPEVNLEAYRATVSDFVKTEFNTEKYREDSASFYKLWLTWGKRYPMTYISSFLINTVDGWYPGAVIDGYRKEDLSSYFDYRVAPPGEEVVLIPFLHEKLDSISYNKESQQGIFFLLFFSPGWFLLCFIHFWFYAISRRYKSFSLAGLVHILHYATVLLGPMALVRYELNFFYGIPVFIWCILEEYNGSKGKEDNLCE